MRESDNLPAPANLHLPHLQRQETEEPWYRVYGGTEINESDDYVVAGISQKIGDVANHRVELVGPGTSYTPPAGWDLDCFIRRDGSARKFPGKLAYLGVENEMPAEKVKVNFPQYIKNAHSLFSKNPKTGKSKTQILQRSAYSQKPVHDIPAHEVVPGAGHPLDRSTRAFMEFKFGYDFSQVRVHTDAKAAEAVRAVNARAFTVGKDVVFGKGEYAPDTTAGQRLMAHELVHVVQQNFSGSPAVKENAPAGIVQCYFSPLDILDYIGLGIDVAERIYLVHFYEGTDKEFHLALNLLFTAMDMAMAILPGAGGGGVAMRASHGTMALAWNALPASARGKVIVEISKGMGWSMVKTTQFINHLMERADGDGSKESGRRRSKHAEQRRSEGRRTGPAFNDAQKAKQSDVFIQPDGRYVVRGSKAREHIFEPGGELLTSIDRSNKAHIGKVRRGERLPVTFEQLEVFKTIFR